MNVEPGSTDVTTYFMMRLAADGTAATGLTATNFDLQYTRSGAAAAAKVDATLNGNGVGGAHSDSTVIEVDATDSPGLYRVDWVDAAFASGVGEVICTVKVATAFTEPLRVELKALTATALANLESQYDTTGLSGNTFPATQSQVSQIGSGGGSANNEFATLSPNGFVITSGENEVNNEDATRAIGGDVHSIDEVDATSTLDVYYLFAIGAAFSPNTIVFTGRMNGNNDDVGVYVNTNTIASPTWVLRATLLGQASSVNQEHVWKLENADQMVGADAGKVAVRFFSNTLSSATLTTDQIVVEKTAITSDVGYANGAIWFDQTASNTNTVPFVDGVADKPVSTWASVKSLIASTGLRIVAVANGSTVTLDANSDGLSLTGEAWTLALGAQSIVNMHVRGANATGLSTGSGSDFHDCNMGTCTIGPCDLIGCRFTSNTGGGFTMQTAGDYLFDSCRSRVAGNAAPVHTFPAAGNTFVNDRAGSGGRQYEGMSAGDMASVEGWGQFIEGTCSGGAVTIRGSLTVSGITNIALTDEARFDQTQVADAVLDEINTGATHNIVNSLGRQIREGTSSVIGAFDVLSATANAVTIDGSASAVAGSYDPSRVYVYEGTGADQSGVVMEYFGSAGGNGNPARTLIFREEFKITLDNTSKLLIISSDGRSSTNQGQLRAGSTTSATLNSLAPSADISGQTLHFTSGTGQDQVALVASYSSPVATFEALDVAVNATTGYELLPTGCANLEHIQNDPQSATDLKDLVDDGYDPATNKVQGVVLVDTTTTNTDMRGTDGANTTTPNTVVPDAEGTAATLLGSGGANLGDLGGMSTAMKAEVKAEAAAALVVIHLDHLLAVDYDPASKPGVATALLNELIVDDGGVSQYSVNALENGPSGSGSSPAVIAAEVWNTLLASHTSDTTFGGTNQTAGGGGTTIILQTTTLEAAPRLAIDLDQNYAWSKEITVEDSQTGKDHVFAVYHRSDLDTQLWKLDTNHITVSGAEGKTLTVADDDENTGEAGELYYELVNTTDDILVVAGPLTIKRRGDTVV